MSFPSVRRRLSRPGEAALTPSGSVHTFIAPGLPILPKTRQEDEVFAMVDKTTDATFDADVLKASGPVVVDFWAEWCGPCRMIAPALEEISNSLNGKVKIVKLNVDENPGTAAKYGIMSIPTLMLFKNGQLASRQVGAAPKQKLEQWITGAM
jgi:thioredoxin 1